MAHTKTPDAGKARVKTPRMDPHTVMLEGNEGVAFRDGMSDLLPLETAEKLAKLLKGASVMRTTTAPPPRITPRDEDEE